MNGIFSATPAPGPIRLIVGSHGLQLVQSGLVLRLPTMSMSFRVLIIVFGLIAVACLILAIMGEGRDANQFSWPRRHRHVR
jgi:hypothetical protein